MVELQTGRKDNEKMSDHVENIEATDKKPPEAVVVKGGAKMTPKEWEKAYKEQKEKDTNPKEIIEIKIEIYKELKLFLETRCKVKKLNFEDVISGLVLDGARLHFNKGCPFCLPAKMEKQQRHYAAKEAFETKKYKTKNKAKKKAKAARKANRGN